MTIARALGIDDFAVVGRSGGGPHALAVAALQPERVSSVAVLVSLAPYNAGGLDWFEGMNEHNVGSSWPSTTSPTRTSTTSCSGPRPWAATRGT